MVGHILLWILISFICGTLIYLIGNAWGNKAVDDLLQSYNATEHIGGVRVNATTVQYTKGETYKFDTTEVDINLDEDFPGERSLTLLLDDNNNLKGIISNDELLSKMNSPVYGNVVVLI